MAKAYSFGSVTAAEWSTTPVGVGGDAVKMVLVESDLQSKGILGVMEGETYVDCGNWWWSLTGKVGLGSKGRVRDVVSLSTTGKRDVVKVVNFAMVERRCVG